MACSVIDINRLVFKLHDVSHQLLGAVSRKEGDGVIACVAIVDMLVGIVSHQIVELQRLIDRKGTCALHLAKNHMTRIVRYNAYKGRLRTVITRDVYIDS